MRNSRVVLALAAALALAACGSDSTSAPRSAATRVRLADAPFPYDSVTAVNVFVRRVEASTSADTLVPGAVTVVSPERVVNLLDFQQGASADLGQGMLDAGTYRAIAIVIDPARSSVRHGDRSVPVQWGHAGDITVHALVEGGLAVPEAGATIVIDFDVGRTFKPILAADSAGIDHYEFRPWTRAVVESATGRVSGIVTCESSGGTAPLADATVFALTGSPGQLTAMSTGRTTATGAYTIAFLMPGTWEVRVEPLFSADCGGASGTVTITAGHTATLDLATQHAAH